MVKLSFQCHAILGPVNFIGCPVSVKCVGTANLVVKLSVTTKGKNGGITIRGCLLLSGWCHCHG